MKTVPLLLLTLAGALAGSIIQAASAETPRVAPDVACAAAPDANLTLRVTPERSLIYSEGPREAVVEIDIEAGRVEESAHRAPMNLALVLDRSGSMQGPKIEKARQAACVALDQLADDDYLSLVIFDDRTELLIPPVRVGGAEHREALKARIDRIRPGGSTAIYAGVSLGAEQVRRHLDKEFVNRIILMSDGIANVGPSRTSDLAALGRDLRQEGLGVTTIGLGDDYNEDLMTALAEASNANYYYVRDAEKLPGIFSEELGASRSVVAREIRIRIKTPEGVRLKEIIGRPEIECGGDSAEIALPEFFGGERRRFLARCVIDKAPVVPGDKAPHGTGDKAPHAAGDKAPHAAGDKAPHATGDNAPDAPFDVVSVELGYEGTGGARPELQRQSARIGFTGARAKSEESVRAEVARDVSISQNRLAKELAVKLADEGRTQEAAKVLRDQVAANAAAPAPAQIPGIAEENFKLDQSARALEKTKSLPGASRKQIQYENWQDKYQKR